MIEGMISPHQASSHSVYQASQSAIPKGNIRAFTLLELLTIVAIVGILVALSIPVAIKATEVALKAKCLGNLRAIGGLIPLYSQDHDGLLPGPSPNGLSARYERGNINDPRTLSHFFIPYVDPGIQSGESKLMEIFVCPAARPLFSAAEATNPLSYGKTGTRKNSIEIQPSPFGGRTGTTITSMPAKVHSLNANLRDIIAVLDRAKPAADSSATAHKTSRNILFMDGHVRNVPLTQIISATEILD